MAKPKILFYDIETLPNISATWGIWQQDVPHVIREWQIASVAWQFNDGKVYAERATGKVNSDKDVCKAIIELWKEADIVVAHNGLQFDNKKVRSRNRVHKLPPPPKVDTIDTKVFSAGFYGFNSNSLKDLCKYLKVPGKLETGGIKLWMDCIDDKKSAWDKMVKYNKQDVVALHACYEEMHGDIMTVKKYANLLTRQACTFCGSQKVMRNGTRVVDGLRYQKFHCLKCFAQFKVEKV